MADDMAARGWGRYLGPQAIARGRLEPAFAAGCGVLMAAVFVLVAQTRSEAPLAFAGFLMVLAGWLLRASYVAALGLEVALVLGIAAQLLGIPWLGAVGQIASLAAIALISHLGASSLAGVQRTTDQERRVRELTFLLDAAQALGSSLDVDVILGTAVATSARGVSRGGKGKPGDAAFHAARGEDLAITVDSRPGARTGLTYPMSRNQAAVGAARSGGAALVRPDHLAGELQDLAAEEGWDVIAMAPVRSGPELYGFLAATSRDGPTFDNDELRLLEVLAHMTSLAIGNAEHLRRERLHAERTEALERTKSELLNLVSHELRGPLTVVRGYVDMLQDGTLGQVPGRPRHVLPIMADKITEMELLVEQTLEASRLEDSRLLLQIERVDLGDVLQRAIRTVSRTGSENHRFNLEAPEPVELSGDPGRLQTIFTNILDNAIKYSPDGGEISVRMSVQGGWARVEIHDPGIGIQPDQIPNLFTRFGRLVTPETSNISGTGLGLYLSRELARMHGGDISVTSRPAHGSTFTVELPVEPAPPAR